MPRTVEEAYEIDKKNENTLWADAIAKEMENIRVAFKIQGNGELPKGYHHVQCRMVFTVKMEDFRRKARLVVGGHMT